MEKEIWDSYKSASDWQGGDNYPGIDAYEKVQLKAGSKYTPSSSATRALSTLLPTSSTKKRWRV